MDTMTKKDEWYEANKHALCVCGHEMRYHRDDRSDACSRCKATGCFDGFIRAVESVQEVLEGKVA